MSIKRNTSLDPLEAILQRLNGTVVKVSKLRQSLGDLEAELSEIHQQCQNEIRARSAASRIQTVADWDNNRDTIMHNSPSHHVHSARIAPDLISVQDSRRDPNPIQQIWDMEGKPANRHTDGPSAEGRRNLDPMESESKNHTTSVSPIPGSSSASGSSAGVMKGENWLRSLVLWPQLRIAALAHVQSGRHSVPPPRRITKLQIPHCPQPPTQVSLFPGVINASPELTRQGNDWFVLFNPSPKVQQALNVTLVHSLKHNIAVTCVKFSQDANWLATGCRGRVQIYNAKTGVKTCVLDHNNAWIWDVSFSPDGKFLATGADDKKIRVWNIAKKQIHDIFKGHQSSIYCLHFSPDGRFIVSGSKGGSVRIWDIQDRTFRGLYLDDHYLPNGHHSGVSSMTLSPDGRYIAVGSANAVVSIWDVTTGMLVQRLRGHRDRISCVAFTPDGKGLISGSWDEMLKYWDVGRSGSASTLSGISRMSSSPCIMNLAGHKDYVLSAAASHDGRWVVSGSKDRSVLFWDMRTGVVQCMLSGHNDSVVQTDLSPVGNLLATAGLNGQVRIWSYE